jgi:hypothetical protein
MIIILVQRESSCILELQLFALSYMAWACCLSGTLLLTHYSKGQLVGKLREWGLNKYISKQHSQPQFPAVPDDAMDVDERTSTRSAQDVRQQGRPEDLRVRSSDVNTYPSSSDPAQVYLTDQCVSSVQIGFRAYSQKKYTIPEAAIDIILSEIDTVWSHFEAIAEFVDEIPRIEGQYSTFSIKECHNSSPDLARISRQASPQNIHFWGIVCRRVDLRSISSIPITPVLLCPCDTKVIQGALQHPVPRQSIQIYTHSTIGLFSAS